eukprot:888117-Pyramimonas_sp.AAC.1
MFHIGGNAAPTRDLSRILPSPPAATATAAHWILVSENDSGRNVFKNDTGRRERVSVARCTTRASVG